MKMKKRLTLTFLFLFASSMMLFAQMEKTVSGVVKDNNGNPLSGVSVFIKGTSRGTTTNANGIFSIDAKKGEILDFSMIGYKGTSVTVDDNNNVNIQMEVQATTGAEVIVTALGIQKQKKSLGYAVQEVKGQALVESRELNLVNDLSAKVSGLQVVRSGNGPGGSSQIILRGNNSFSGPSQPLIVVDGVPMDNSTGRVGIGSTNDFWNPSLDMGNGLSDINPDDIASISVLKGPAAASLYGSLGGNGVILITTKTGRKQPGLGVTVSSSVGFEGILTNPEMQNLYAQGSNGKYDSLSGSSWGPKINGQLVTDWSGKQVTLQPYNNVSNFFKNGTVSNQNISIQQKINSTSIYASYNRFDDKSMIPGAKLSRNNLTARALTKFGKNENWTLDTKVQFINATANNRSLEGQNGSIFATIYNLPRTLNILNFQNPLDQNGNMFWWQKGNGMNPYWAAQYNLNTDTRNRYILYATVKHDFTSWLSGEATAGADMYSTSTEAKLYAGSPGNLSGRYSLGKQTYQQTNYSGMLTAKKDNLFGKLGGSVMVGGNLMHWTNSAINIDAGTLQVPNLFSVTNSTGKPGVDQAFSQKKINSLYGAVELNYDGYLFLNGTFRNDWSSALANQNKSYFYPSVSLSYVFTDMMSSKGWNLPSWLSYGKLRATYAAAGSDLNPYELYNTYVIGTDPNNNTTASRNSILYDSTVRSQLIKSYEAGAELRFLNNKIGLDVSVYKSNAIRQLINLPMDPLSGYSAMKVNGGNVQNTGVEVTLDARILENPKSLNWTMGVNFSHNKNTVPSIYPGVNKYQLGGFDNIQVLAVAGQPFGEIYGSKLLRVTDSHDPNYGQLILTSNGLPKATTDITRLGNQQANALLGFSNSFSYKGFGLGILLDARIGGKIFSQTLDNMERSGTAAITVSGASRDSMIVQGVIPASGGGGYVSNTNKISTQQYWAAVAGAGNTGITEANLYDATNLRIRNIQLSYTLPKRILEKSFIQKAVVSLSCNNAWLISSHMHGLDPESVYATGTPAVGFENGSAPTTRTFYINLSLGF
ncbi:MAG: SusC/RagA family TonB-linked outer membrane protein [Bacteroidetes bacterium]|nr:SusC/RagA family TonB-linked outer membrane protein [Bacteroidota bacterium]MBS1931125.1 SusC/RagA family TonB-linked outer membrane protein [Bacteroidota bacterium]